MHSFKDIAGCRPVSSKDFLPKLLRHAPMMFGAAVDSIRQEFWIRSEIARLSALDDQLLADIAVSRRDIRQAVRGRSADPRLRPRRRS